MDAKDMTPEQRKALAKSNAEGRRIGIAFVNSIAASIRGKIPERLKTEHYDAIGRAIARARGVPC